MTKLDTNFYSRQIYTLGMEAMNKLTNLNIFIFGLQGLGVEISKNIILAGPKKVLIFDDNKVSLSDLGSNFYLTKNDINTRRDEACLIKLKENNQYVEVEISNDFNNSLNECNIIVITQIMKLEKLYEINDFCRNNKKGFIYAGLFGITNFLFVDFGENHIIFDPDGEEKKIFNIKNIKNLKNNKLLINVDENDNILKNNEVYLFKNIEGSIELNGKDFKINDPKNLSFEINYDKEISEYKRGGILEQIKIPIHKSYKSLKETFYDPFGEEIDQTKNKRNFLIHIFIISLHHYFNKYNSLPELNNESQAIKIFNEAEKIFNQYKNKSKFFGNCEEIFEKEKNIIKSLSKISNSQLAPLCSFLGGIVASEIIKFTGIYNPLNQYMWMDNLDSLKNLNILNDSPIYSRYDEQISIFGLDLHKKLTKLKVFIIGAGALGCELLKIFSLMGIGTDPQGKIIVIDYDNIEKSNLNRQFLFNNKDIGKSKSKCACDAIKKINPEINCIDSQLMMNKDAEYFFDEKFWNCLDLIVLSVDNVEARKFVDKRCTIYRKKLIECGTEGVKASSHIFIPYKTGCYNDIPNSNEQKEIPMCTLKLFPSNIEHCIEWAKNIFYECFVNDINDTLLFIKNIDFFENLSNPFEILNKLEIVNEIIFISLNQNNFDNCIKLGMKKYYNYFIKNIQILIESKPENFLDKEGNLFWTGNKKFPHAINYDKNNEFCLNFIYNYSLIIAKILSIEQNSLKDINYIKNYADKYIFEKSNQLTEEEAKLKSNQIKLELKNTIKNINIAHIHPEEFEKDNDENHHIDFIYNCTNLRAQNYTIPINEREIIKQKAGKIIPAMATTTATVCGFLSSQIYSIINDNVDRKFLKEINFCLSSPYFCLTMPRRISVKKNYISEEIEYHAIPKDFSVWNLIEIEGSLTVKQFKEFFKEKYKVQIYGFYNLEYDSLEFKNEENLIENNYFLNYKKPRDEIFIFGNQNNKNKNDILNIYFIIDGELDENNPAIMPIIKYSFKKDKINKINNIEKDDLKAEIKKNKNNNKENENFGEDIINKVNQEQVNLKIKNEVFEIDKKDSFIISCKKRDKINNSSEIKYSDINGKINSKNDKNFNTKVNLKIEKTFNDIIGTTLAHSKDISNNNKLLKKEIIINKKEQYTDTINNINNYIEISEIKQNINNLNQEKIIEKNIKSYKNSLEEYELNKGNDYNNYDNNILSVPINNEYGCVGLNNLGNTCYMNSSLQILKNIFALTKYILQETKINNGYIINEYRNLLYNLILKTNNSIDATEFKNALSKYNDYFSGHQQKDCIMCIISILSALNNDLKRKKIEPYNIIYNNDEEEKKFNDAYNKIIKRKNSIIFDIFYGFLKISYKCSNEECGYKKIVFQSFNYLDMSIFDIEQNKKINNLKECIKYYERETISEFKCQCGSEIKMKNTIYKLPKVLIINFNRVYNQYHLNHLVEYPEFIYSDDFKEKPTLLNNSDLNNQKEYSLNGIIIHYGSADSGHKIAFCKNFFIDNWLYFDDTKKYKIKYVTKDILNRKDAFLLIYQNSSIEINDSEKASIKKIFKNNKDMDLNSNLKSPINDIANKNQKLDENNLKIDQENNKNNFFNIIKKKFFS